MKIKDTHVSIFLVLILLIIFHWWFLPWVIVWWDFRVRSLDFFTDFLDFSLWSDSLLWWISLDYNGYLNKFPIYLLGWIFANMGMSYEIIQRLVFLFPILYLWFLSVFLTSRYLFWEKTLSIVLSVVYLTFPFFLENIYRSHIWFSLVYAIFPFLLLFSLKYIDSNKQRYIWVTSFFLSALFAIEPRIGLLMSFVILILVIILRYDNLAMRGSMFYIVSIGKILFWFVLLSSYWIIPLFWSIFLTKAEVISSSIMNTSFINYSASTYGNIINSLTLMPQNWEWGGIVWFLFLWGMMVFFLKRRKHPQKKNLYLFLLILIFLFFAKWVYPPFWNITFELLKSNVIFSAFKTTNKFLYPVWLLLVVLLWCILHTLKNKNFLFILIWVYILLQNSFLITAYIHKFGINQSDGFVLYKWEQHMFYGKDASYFKDYQYIYEYIKKANTSRFKTLWLPTIHTFRYTSNKFWYLDVNFYNFSDDKATPFFSPNGKINIEFLEKHNLKMFLCEKNIEYIVLKWFDATEWGYGNSKYEDYQGIFSDFKRLFMGRWWASLYDVGCERTQEMVIHNIDIYRATFFLNIMEEVPIFMRVWFHPWWKLYLEPYSELDCKNQRTIIPETKIYKVQAWDDFNHIASKFETTKEKLIDLNPNWDISGNSYLEVDQEIQVPKKSESNSGWETYSVTECQSENKIFVGDELSKLWQKSIFDDTHTMVYDYANQWTIDPEYIKANYPKEYYKENPDWSIDIRLTLYFKPQSYFYLGLIISWTTFLILVFYLIIDSIRVRRKNK